MPLYRSSLLVPVRLADGADEDGRLNDLNGMEVFEVQEIGVSRDDEVSLY